MSCENCGHAQAFHITNDELQLALLMLMAAYGKVRAIIVVCDDGSSTCGFATPNDEPMNAVLSERLKAFSAVGAADPVASERYLDQHTETSH